MKEEIKENLETFGLLLIAIGTIIALPFALMILLLSEIIKDLTIRDIK